MRLQGMRGVRRATMGAVTVAALCCGGWVAAPAVMASPIDDTYLAAIEANGVPILGRDYVIGLGHAICDTARQNPSMPIVDLVLTNVGNENMSSPYDFEQGKVIAAAALTNYCPGVAANDEPAAPVTAPPPVLPPVPAPNVPNVNAPGVGCTWVDGYTRKNGTRVSGHYRC